MTMMTQEQLIHTFKGYPKPLKSSVLRKLMRVFEEDLVGEVLDNADADKRDLSVEERLAVVESLSGSLKMDDPPMTKEEDREFYYGHLLEKYK